MDDVEAEAAEAAVAVERLNGLKPSHIQETWLHSVQHLEAETFRWRLGCGWVFIMGMEPDRIPALGTRFWWEPKSWTADKDGKVTILGATIYVPYTHTEAGTPVYFPWDVFDGYMGSKLAHMEEAKRPMANQSNASNNNPAFREWAKALPERERVMLGQAWGIVTSPNGKPELLPLGDVGPWLILLGKVAAAVASNFEQSQEPSKGAPPPRANGQQGATYQEEAQRPSQARSNAPRGNQAPPPKADPKTGEIFEDEYEPPKAGDNPNANAVTDKQLKAIYAIGRANGRLTSDQVEERSVEVFGVHPKDLTKGEASQFIEMLKSGQERGGAD